jgi:predicted nucleotidyltransferase
VKLQKDLKEFIELMNSHEVNYVIVGGHAVAYHGYPRFTGDIDFFVKPSPENALRLIAVLHSFGFLDVAGVEAALVEVGKVIQLGRPPNRIDLLTGISGVDFDQAFEDSVATDIDGIPVRIIGLESLLKNKAASGRPKDQLDLDQLKKAQGRPQQN